MQLSKAQRSRIPIKMGIAGSSGSGKSLSALLIAYGLTGDWTRIAVIDAENKSAHLYAHLGSYNVLDLQPPFTPERYIQALHVCLQSRMQVIIIDSISFEWENLVESHSRMPGNSYTNWCKYTPRHQQFVQAILQADCHIICTLRSKQDYVLVEKNGKQVPEKVSMKPIQREGIDYEFTLLFELDTKHQAIATKDRTELFSGRSEFVITDTTGNEIRDWCYCSADTRKSIREPEKPHYELSKLILECETVEELRQLYYSVSEEEQKEFRGEFDRQKDYLSPPVGTPQVHTPTTNLSTTHFNSYQNNGNSSLNGSARK